MKKIIILTLLWCTASVAVFAQPSKQDKAERKERIKAEKVKFINQGLDLTEKESVLFWDLVDKMDAEKRTIIKKYKPKKAFEWMSDEEAEKAILDRFQQEESLNQLRKDYYWKMKEVISPRKIAAYHKLERQFKKRLLKMRKNRQNHRPERN